ncbi:MAG: hypothetical protein HY520_04865, partial [Candidatus Aenigmarchaeota archaeon]|nr:hypothetical protein [Candidatus Aenigmarchaeota archaeon]
MSKDIIAIATILITGLISGLFFGIQMKTGIDPHPNSLMLNILSAFCRALPDKSIMSSCGTTILLASLGLLAIGIIEIFATASSIGNWIIG